MITAAQNEIIARAMGWKFEPNHMPAGWVRMRSRYGDVDYEFSPRYPRYDEPGELHEEMVGKFSIATTRPYTNWEAYSQDAPYTEVRVFHESRPIAECLAVLAYLAWIDEREE